MIKLTFRSIQKVSASPVRRAPSCNGRSRAPCSSKTTPSTPVMQLLALAAFRTILINSAHKHRRAYLMI
jgi:hypothetical protein